MKVVVDRNRRVGLSVESQAGQLVTVAAREERGGDQHVLVADEHVRQVERVV